MLNTLLLALLIGLAVPLLLPTLLSATPYSSSVGNSWARFAAKALQRPALGVGKHGDLSLRQLSFDQTYDAETVEVDGVEQKITRTAANVHRMGKTPFAFFDEHFGVTFDLRDVLIGRLQREHRDDGEMVYTLREYHENGEPKVFEQYVRAFFEVDDRRGLDLNLDESVRPIVDGSEKSHWWEHMWEAVKRMYRHRQEDTATWRMLLPFIVAGAAFLLGFYVLGPGKMPGGDGGGLDPVTVGAPLLLAAPELTGRRKRLLAWAGVGLLTVFSVGLGLAVAPLQTAAALGGLLIGACVLPVLTLVLGAIGYGTSLADLFLWAGLQAFDEPVVELTENDQYKICEADALGLENPPKVTLSKTLVGLSCEVSTKAFGRAGNSSSELIDYLPDDVVVGNGGRSPSDAVPRDHVVTSAITNAGHRGFMPSMESLDPNATYVRSDNWLGRFANAATGDTLDVAETEATDEFADGGPALSDGQLMRWSAMGAVASLAFWVVVWLAF